MNGNKERHLIIGGSKGAGRSLAQRLLNSDCDVVVVCRQKPRSPLEGATYLECDLSDQRQLTVLLNEISTNFVPHHISFFQRYRGGSEAAWEGELKVSLSATKDIIEHLTEVLSLTGRGTITICGSVFGRFVGHGQEISYHIVKCALEQLVRYYAVTLGPKRIRVNGVIPSQFLKEESKEAVLRDAELLAISKTIIPLGRLGTADEVVSSVMFLASSEASYITGNCLVLDGGLSLVWPGAAAVKARKAL